MFGSCCHCVVVLATAALYLESSAAFRAFLPPHTTNDRSAAFTSSTPLTHNKLGMTARFDWTDEIPESSSGSHGLSREDLFGLGMSDARLRRLREEEERRARFVSGDELHALREEVLGLRYQLQAARRERAVDLVDELEQAILDAQQHDAEFVYQMSLEKMEAAKRAGFEDEANMYYEEALSARKALPQFNLEGLWVGQYGEHGFELINVTYIGDTLVAHKVTGDENVPKNEVSFTVDLRTDVLEPIELAEDAADQWGSRYLQRFSGQGQVASKGFANSQWMDGQLILVNQYFSFSWLPIKYQVFFGRPSAELTLKLLRESQRKDTIDEAREHLNRCMEETEMLEEDMEISDGIFKSHDQSWYYDQEGCFE